MKHLSLVAFLDLTLILNRALMTMTESCTICEVLVPNPPPLGAFCTTSTGSSCPCDPSQDAPCGGNRHGTLFFTNICNSMHIVCHGFTSRL